MWQVKGAIVAVKKLSERMKRRATERGGECYFRQIGIKQVVSWADKVALLEDVAEIARRRRKEGSRKRWRTLGHVLDSALAKLDESSVASQDES